MENDNQFEKNILGSLDTRLHNTHLLFYILGAALVIITLVLLLSL